MDDRPVSPIHKRKRRFRIIFLCGAVCWLLLWFTSINFETGVTFRFDKGQSRSLGVTLGGLYAGSFKSHPDESTGAIWFEPELNSYAFTGFNHDVNPLIFAGPLGGFHWQSNQDGLGIGIPLSFPLALWLLMGWMAHRKDWRALSNSNLDAPSEREKAISRSLRIALIALVCQMAGSSIAMVYYWKEDDTRTCHRNMRDIQQTFQGYSGMNELYPGNPIPWERIHESFSSDSSRRCPGCGEEYILETHVPTEWGRVVTCPNQRHMESLKTAGFNDW